MNLALKYPPRYTIKDYESWEGDWELIEGVPYALASPSFKHQRIVLKIARYLDEVLEKECPDCVVGIDADYVVSEDTVLRPDIFITCEEVEDKLLKPPKVIFEVVSPSTREKDEKLKFELYQREGVPYFVLVYPDLKKAKIYKLTDRGYKKLTDVVNDKVEFELNGCKIELDFSKVWI